MAEDPISITDGVEKTYLLGLWHLVDEIGDTQGLANRPERREIRASIIGGSV